MVGRSAMDGLHGLTRKGSMSRYFRLHAAGEAIRGRRQIRLLQQTVNLQAAIAANTARPPTPPGWYWWQDPRPRQRDPRHPHQLSAPRLRWWDGQFWTTYFADEQG